VSVDVNNNQDALQKVRAYAFLLLKFRQRSESEIYQRLKRKKFDEPLIKDTVTFLKDKGFIDDKLFAKAWIESRIKKPFGLRRIKQELKLKGIDKEIIDKQIGEIKEKYLEEEIVLKVAQDRFNRLKTIDLDIARRRLYSYLMRRGFSPEIIIDTLNLLCKQTS